MSDVEVRTFVSTSPPRCYDYTPRVYSNHDESLQFTITIVPNDTAQINLLRSLCTSATLWAYADSSRYRCLS